MKKIITLVCVAIVALVLAACTPSGDVEITIAFVPSQNASQILTKTKALEALLEDEIEGYNFKITVGTTYDAVVEGMLSGQIQVGFLTAQQYAAVTTENPGKVEVMLTSIRSGYNFQFDDEGNEITDEATLIAAINSPSYDGSVDATKPVSSYYSMLLVKDDSDIEEVADLAGKLVGTQATTSGSGFVYPAVLLHEHNLSFVSGTPNAANGEVQYQTLASHPASIDALMNDDVDAVFTFLDVRTQKLNDYPNIFTDTRVVALTPGIYNDTISVVKDMDPALKTKLQNAFIEIAKTDVGKEAISVYSHTGYMIATDSQYDGERAVYLFKKNQVS